MARGAISAIQKSMEIFKETDEGRISNDCQGVSDRSVDYGGVRFCNFNDCPGGNEVIILKSKNPSIIFSKINNSKL